MEHAELDFYSYLLICFLLSVKEISLGKPIWSLPYMERSRTLASSHRALCNVHNQCRKCIFHT